MVNNHTDITLVINLSLRSIRVLLFQDNGDKVYEDWLPIRTSIDGKKVEQDPNEWWNLAVELVKKACAHEQFGKRIRYITVTSSALCMVMIDQEGKVINKSLMVSDKRADQEAKELAETFSDFFTQNNSYKCEAGYFFPKILWLQRNDKALFSRVHMFLSANDFFLFKLTGKVVTDTLNAEKFYYDSNTNKYPVDILQHCQITSNQLPTVVNPGESIGTITPQIQELFATTNDIHCIVSTYDAICALIGSASYQEGELNNVCGTCSSYRFFSKKSLDTQHTTLLHQHISGEEFSIVGASNNLEGGVLEWAKECFYGDSYLKDDNFLYGLMQTEARESELGAKGIIFLPYLLGERMPFIDANVRGNFFGIERFHTRKDIIRSVFEAVNFQAKLVLEEFHKIGVEISSINMSGGVAKMMFAAQLRADILGLPINVLEEVETTALGAFILSLKARGVITSITQATSFIKIKKTFIPNMHNHNCYSSLFVLYKQLYTDHRELYIKRKDTFEKITHYRKQVLENL